MSQWNVTIPDQTDRLVRSHLERRGLKEGDLSQFVDVALRRAVFWETVDAAHERNREVPAQEIDEAVNRAVDETRARRP